jgi:hypothetical protein
MATWIKSGIVGGAILFIWSAISWMALPWHMATLNGYEGEKAVTDVIKANVSHSGMYILPMKMQENTKDTTFLFGVVKIDGESKPMSMSMGLSLLSQIIAAWMAAWMLMKANRTSYLSRFTFILVFAVAADILAHVPYWIWFCFDTNYTLVNMADFLIGWIFAGLAMAGLARR